MRKERLLVVLRELPADRLHPHDGVSIVVHFGTSRADVTSPIRFKGANRGILAATANR
jgi:hypothetical protein